MWGASRIASLRAMLVGARDRRDEIARWRRDLNRFERKCPESS